MRAAIDFDPLGHLTREALEEHYAGRRYEIQVRDPRGIANGGAWQASGFDPFATWKDACAAFNEVERAQLDYCRRHGGAWGPRPLIHRVVDLTLPYSTRPL